MFEFPYLASHASETYCTLIKKKLNLQDEFLVTGLQKQVLIEWLKSSLTKLGSVLFQKIFIRVWGTAIIRHFTVWPQFNFNVLWSRHHKRINYFWCHWVLFCQLRKTAKRARSSTNRNMTVTVFFWMWNPIKKVSAIFHPRRHGPDLDIVAVTVL